MPQMFPMYWSLYSIIPILMTISPIKMNFFIKKTMQNKLNLHINIILWKW